MTIITCRICFMKKKRKYKTGRGPLWWTIRQVEVHCGGLSDSSRSTVVDYQTKWIFMDHGDRPHIDVFPGYCRRQARVLKCLALGHSREKDPENPVRLEPGASSLQFTHSTTLPRRTHIITYCKIYPYFPGDYFTIVQHNILHKPLAAFQHTHRR